MHCKTVKVNYFHFIYIFNSLGEATIEHMCEHSLFFIDWHHSWCSLLLNQLQTHSQNNLQNHSKQTISSSVISFFSCLQSSPATGSFQTSQFFASGGHSIGISASASVFPMKIQDWFSLGWTIWISLQCKGLPRVFSDNTVKSINSSVLSCLYSETLTSIHDYWKKKTKFWLDGHLLAK